MSNTDKPSPTITEQLSQWAQAVNDASPIKPDEEPEAPPRSAPPGRRKKKRRR